MPTLVQDQTQCKPALMPFGQFKGSRLDQLPNDYLLWVAMLPDLRQPLLGHILKEMGRRLAELDHQPATGATTEGTP
jgi:uncharacterized protein (DUF3820 family)